MLDGHRDRVLVKGDSAHVNAVSLALQFYLPFLALIVSWLGRGESTPEPEYDGLFHPLLFVLLIVCLSLNFLDGLTAFKILLGVLAAAGLGRLRARRSHRTDVPDFRRRPGTYLSLMVLVLLAGLLLRVANLRAVGLIHDERLHFGAAVGHFETGRYLIWDFVNQTAGNPYSRAWIYTYQVSQVLDWFGTDLATARLVSVAWGLLALITVWAVAKFLRLSPALTLVSVLFAALSPYHVLVARWVRMYVMFSVTFGVFFISTYCFFFSSDRRTWYLSAFSLLITLILCLHLHPVLLITALPGMALFVVKEVSTRDSTTFSIQEKLIPTALIAAVVLLAVESFGFVFGPQRSFLTTLFILVKEQFSFPSMSNLLYPGLMLDGFYGWTAGGITFALMFLLHRSKREEYVLWTLSVMFVGLLFSAKHPTRARYVGHFLTISIPLFVVTWRRALDLFTGLPNPARLSLGFTLIVLLPSLHLLHGTDQVYDGSVDATTTPAKRPYHFDFDELPGWIERHVPPSENIYYAQLPNYHASKIDHPREKLFPTSTLRLLSDDFHEEVRRTPGRSWIIVADWFRPSTFHDVQPELEDQYHEVPNELRGIHLYRTDDQNRPGR